MFTGSIVALVTPFRDNALDEPALKKLIRWHLDQGSHGIVPVGTTGESPTLSSKEQATVVEITVAEVAGQVPIIAGAGSNNPTEALAFTEHAARVGADGVLQVMGYYIRPNPEGVYQHYAQLSQASELPSIVYNIPARTCVDIAPETMARLADLPGVVGVKDATCDLSRPLKERALIPGDFSFLSGEDPTCVAYNANGGNGCISVTANVAPKLCAQLQDHCMHGEYDRALALQQRLLKLHESLRQEPNPSGVKYACSLLGLCTPECRTPLVPLTKPTQQLIQEAMEQLGML